MKTFEKQVDPVAIPSWKLEMEKASRRYHLIACWVAIIFDPIFAFTDYLNIPDQWQQLLIIRLSVSLTIGVTLLVKERLKLSTHAVVSVPFLLISLQNAYTYALVGPEDLLGHSLNYMALLVGAAMFVLWPWVYSVVIVVVSCMATSWFILNNNNLTLHEFFVDGGLLLITASIFMIVLIQTRYQLTSREIKARIALQLSKAEVEAQAEEIRTINENLERLVNERTRELQLKNQALEEAAFINAHKLRSPAASLLGLINLMQKTQLDEEGKYIMTHMSDSAKKLDAIIRSITIAIEKGDEVSAP